MATTLGLTLRVWFGRTERALHRRPLLAPLTAISGEALREAKLRADRCIAEGFVLRNNPVWRPRPPIRWGHNPRHDVNWHYRVNTLEPVEPLLHAYRCGAGEEYFLLARAVVVDWIDYNLVRNGANRKKWHDMATGLRARVFGQVLDTELRRPNPNPTIVGRLVWALAQHARFLADPKNQSWTGNHTLFMMYGLAYLLQALPELHEVDAYHRYCVGVTKELVGSQFSSDGIHLEHSPEYHLYLTETIADMVENQLCTELTELPELVQRARDHHQEFFHPNGDLAMLGDSERRASDRHGPDPQRELCRLTDAPGVTDPSQLRVSPASGYATFRSHFGARATPRDDYFVLGAGHHSRVHKHADHLSFEWSFRGVPVLTNSGKGTYNVDTWMKYFRSTRAGNAVEVDERNYGRTPHEGRCHIVAWGESGGLAYAVARHYADRFEMTQTRALVALSGQYLLVIDQLESSQAHVYRQWFHLHEALSLEQHAERLHVTDAQNQRVLTIQELTGHASLERVKGQTLPRKQGFVSPVYHARIPRHSVAFCQRGSSVDFVALFAADPAHSPEVSKQGAALDIRWFDAAGRSQSVRFTPASPDPISRIDS